MATLNIATIEPYSLLPALDHFAGDTTERPSSVARKSGSKARILVVDDEELIANSLAEILSGEGFDTMIALSGTEAVTIARHFRPDLVISDIMMPDLDGVQTAFGILKSCPEARILLFSGQAETSDILDKARAEGHDFELLAKPIHPDRLLSTIRKLL